MRNEPSLRLPIPTEAADFDGMPDLSDEERQMGAMMIEAQFLGAIDNDGPADQRALKLREPLFLAVYDPQVAATFLGQDLYGQLVVSVSGLTFEELYAAATAPEGFVSDDPVKAAGWRQAMLMVYAVAQEFDDEFTMRLMATKPNLFTAEESVMVGHPEANVWNDDERLVLEFTRAVLRHAVTDELFGSATSAWGTKGMLRRASWIGLYNYYLMFADINVTDAQRNGSIKSRG